jgi:RNA polymerase sigma factor (sigma-70 family)
MASNREEINKLFERSEEFIPPEILEPVRNFVFAAQRKYGLNHETFKDLVQECLIKIWTLERKFKSQPPIYFVGVARNTIVDGCREQARSSRMDAKLKEFFSINEEQMMNDVLRQMYSKVEFDALIRTVLTDEEAAVVIRRCEGLTLQRISVVMGLSLTTVNRRYSKALKKLRKQLRPVATERHENNVEINP